MAVISNPTIMLVLLSLVFSVAPQKENKGNHQDKVCYNYWDFYGTRCCEQESFTYQHLRNHEKNCAVPPKDESISRADCYWKFVHCLASKSLKDTGSPFTLTNFGQLMAQNLTQDKKSAIVSQLKQLEGGNVEISLEDTNKFKIIWNQYMDTEYQVCNANLSESEAEKNISSLVGQQFKRRYWAPMATWGNESYPNVELTMDVNSFDSCVDYFNTTFDLKNNTMDHQIMYIACRLKGMGLITIKEIESNTINFENFIDQLIPKFLTTSLKTKTMQKIFKRAPGPKDAIATELKFGKGNYTNLADAIEGTKRYAQEYCRKNKNHSQKLKKMCPTIMTLENLSYWLKFFL